MTTKEIALSVIAEHYANVSCALIREFIKQYNRCTEKHDRILIPKARQIKTAPKYQRNQDGEVILLSVWFFMLFILSLIFPSSDGGAMQLISAYPHLVCKFSDGDTTVLHD